MRSAATPVALATVLALAGIGCASGGGAKPGGSGGGAGTTGDAGSGGTTGEAGSGGTSGDAGSGGAAGIGGSLAGAGGATGGDAGGSGGVAGTAGTGGAGGGGTGSGGDGGSAYPRPSYQKLSETGLYMTGSKALASGVQPYEPVYQLWSDNADKRRWVRLPAGAQIDTSDMDHWKLPIGTKMWKEFSRNGTLLETRLIERYGAGAEDCFMAAFVWAADGSDATIAIDGATNVNGTTHDVPMAERCGDCHRGEPGRYLGFSALQLSRPVSGTGLTLSTLRGSGRLTQDPPFDFPLPGDINTMAAMGMMHANCGHCHNPAGAAWHDTKIVMRIKVSERVPWESEMWKTLVGQPIRSWSHPTITTLVVPGDAAKSAVVARMMARGSMDQMPPLGTEYQDVVGIQAVSAWINDMSTP